jgi:uncharacterized membrane protein HdeD (DUF308 family)
MEKEKAWKWLSVALGALVALQLYFVRQLLAAYFLFAIVFAVLLVFAAIFFILEEVGERSFVWAEAHAVGLLSLARRRFAHPEGFGKKSFRGPNSRTVG